MTELKRSIIESSSRAHIDYTKQILGLLFYLITFGIVIPYTIIKARKVDWLEGYLPNLDLIAMVLGFRGGPFSSDIFKYLYNPVTSTTYGYYSQMLFNYIALLGLTYVVAYYTLKTKSVSNGWSRAFIMLWMTYLLPSNLLAYLADKLGTYVDKSLGTTRYTYGIVISVLGMMLFGLVTLEKSVVQHLAPSLSAAIDKITAYLAKI